MARAKWREAYLDYLYTPEGQEIAAKNFYRPTDPKVAAAHAKDFPQVATFTIDDVFGGWNKAQTTHFADGGLLRPDLQAEQLSSPDRGLS